MARFAWKKDKVLETKVSVLQGEMRQLKWALFGSFSECAKLRTTLQANGIKPGRRSKKGGWSRVEARELFNLAWKYLWSSEALYINLRTITIVSIDDLKCAKDGFRFIASHVPTDGLSIPKRATWTETANWDEFSCTAWSWTGSYGGWTVDFDPRTIQAARAAGKGVNPKLEGRERVKELKQLMDEWRQIIAEKSIVTEYSDIDILKNNYSGAVNVAPASIRAVNSEGAHRGQSVRAAGLLMCARI